MTPAREKATHRLSRSSILDAAHEIVERDGVGGLSVRRLTRRLGVSPMAVYNYFDSKEEILAELIDRVVEEAATTQHDVASSDWREWIQATFAGMYRALRDRNDMAPLLADLQKVGPAASRVLSDVLRVLGEAGFDPQESAAVFDTLIRYTMGAALLPAIGRPQDDPGGLASDLLVLRRGIDTILDGIALEPVIRARLSSSRSHP